MTSDGLSVVRIVRRALAGAAVSAMLLISVGAGVASADGPTVTVEPSGPLVPGPQTITVRGSGFDAEANRGVGVYLVFGPLMDEPTYYTDANLYGAARWVHPGVAAGPGQAELGADGTFTTTLDIDPHYVDGNGREVDCFVDDCHVITMAAHGTPDRSQDTFTPVAFQAAASGAPTAVPSTPAPAHSSPPPVAPATPANIAADTTLIGVVAGVLVGLVALGAIVLLLRRRRA